MASGHAPAPGSAVRIALDQRSEVGTRAGRILLAEPDLELLGLVDRNPSDEDDRLVRVLDLSTYDVVVTDATDPSEVLAAAAAAGVPAVTWVDRPVGSVPVASDAAVLVGANLGSGIAPSLAAHEAAGAGEGSPIDIVWTEPGRPLRRGHPSRFPDPVGPLWAAARGTSGTVRRFAAPTQGDWAGAVVHVTAAEHPRERIVAVADHAAHLEALALAAGAMVAVGSAFAELRGVVTVDDIADPYLDAVLGLGLEVAEWRSA